MCKLSEYSSFVCMMALSSVLDRKIFCYNPEDVLPALVKYFNCELSSWSNSSCSNILHLLGLRDGNFDNRPKVPYTPNHSVPLIAISNLKDVQYQVEKPDGKKN